MSAIALSFSRLNTYNQCPNKFKLEYIDKVFTFDDKSPHLVRGSNIHKQLEDYTNAAIRQETIPTVTVPEVSKECVKPTKMVNSFIDKFDVVLAEQQVCVDKNWKKVDWFSKQAYYRAIFDMLAYDNTGELAVLIDWKTGKVRDYNNDDEGQLRLSACILFSILKNINKVTCAYVFVDHEETIAVDFYREEHEAMLKTFDSAHNRVNNDQTFDAEPNKFCKWCQATKDQCVYAPTRL